jgi:hypothetical protein
MKRNFFTALFLYSYMRCRIAAERRVFYTAINQCLRGLVTGCDNLLDHEYKMTLDTDLPATAVRFRSVLDIMVSDRVLFEILLDYPTKNEIPLTAVTMASRASLQALTRSGTQEAAEEAAIEEERLPPERVLSEIHHYKTGILFQCPWAVPSVMEQNHPTEMPVVKDALYQIGIGCQIMDDMVDLSQDLRNHHQNYMASLISFGTNIQAKKRLQEIASLASPDEYFLQFPELARQVYLTAERHLKGGLGRLFMEKHRFMVDLAAAFIAERIGVDRFAISIGGR